MISSLPKRGPYPENAWGRWQTGVMVGDPPASGRTPASADKAGRSNPPGSWTVYALELPDSNTTVASVRIESTAAVAFAIGGITMFDGVENPLRHEPL
ncbi:MAG: hypothetical protein O2921_08700 [Chloroflexi bacterium]|nr:hypothetical protein [Chloroflexota bacterium]MDA1282680.1 hypothetical protein [Chloroflexota bacterium]